MPTIKKEAFGEGSIYTLRNTKGNELKITDIGARIVSMRLRDKDFKNRFVLSDEAASSIIVDGGADFAEVIWQAEETLEGVKFTAQVGDKSATVIYSLSNDNEISIIYESQGIADISAKVAFSASALPDIDFRACQKGSDWEKISDEKTYPITQPAEVEMEIGMFGYDPGCPIDYLDAGLKNAANLFCADASIELIVYATQNEIHAQAVDGGFALWTGGSSSGQTVYMLKNRK